MPTLAYNFFFTSLQNLANLHPEAPTIKQRIRKEDFTLPYGFIVFHVATLNHLTCDGVHANAAGRRVPA